MVLRQAAHPMFGGWPSGSPRRRDARRGKGANRRGELSETVLAWLACATLGAVGVTTNTKSVGAEMTYFAERTGAVAAITQPQYAVDGGGVGPR